MRSKHATRNQIKSNPSIALIDIPHRLDWNNHNLSFNPAPANHHSRDASRRDIARDVRCAHARAPWHRNHISRPRASVGDGCQNTKTQKHKNADDEVVANAARERRRVLVCTLTRPDVDLIDDDDGVSLVFIVPLILVVFTVGIDMEADVNIILQEEWIGWITITLSPPRELSQKDATTKASVSLFFFFFSFHNSFPSPRRRRRPSMSVVSRDDKNDNPAKLKAHTE